MAATTALVVGATAAATGAATQLKASSDARKAASKTGVDINALDAQTRQIALRNARESAALEQQMNPEIVALRLRANQQALANLTRDPNQEAAIGMLLSGLGQNYNTALTDAAIAKAQQDLALGGQLSQDQRNEATRSALAKTGVITGNLGLGRDIVARDLGITSAQLEQQRLQNAANLAGLELNREQANATNFLNSIGLLNNYYNNNRNMDLATAQYAQSIQQPIVGLDPASIANLTVGNANAQTQAQMQAAAALNQSGSGLMSLGGSLIGASLVGGALSGGGAKVSSFTPIQKNTLAATPTGTWQPTWTAYQPTASQFISAFKPTP